MAKHEGHESKHEMKMEHEKGGKHHGGMHAKAHGGMHHKGGKGFAAGPANQLKGLAHHKGK